MQPAADDIHGVAVMISSPTGADDMPLLSQWIKKFDKSKLVEFFGRGRRTRTHDPWFWRPVLYQLSYTPKYYCIIQHSEEIVKGFYEKNL